MFISETIKKSWEIVKKEFLFFAGITFMYFFISFGISFILSKYFRIYILSELIIIVIVYWISLGITIITLKKAKGEKAFFFEIFSGTKYLASYIGADILYNIIVTAGFILLIFPAVIWSIKFMFFPYFIITKNMKAIQSLKASAEITYNAKWDLLAFSIISSIIVIIGILCLGIGILIALPVVWIAKAFFYLELEKKLNK